MLLQLVNTNKVNIDKLLNFAKENQLHLKTIDKKRVNMKFSKRLFRNWVPTRVLCESRNG